MPGPSPRKSRAAAATEAGESLCACGRCVQGVLLSYLHPGQAFRGTQTVVSNTVPQTWAVRVVGVRSDRSLRPAFLLTPCARRSSMSTYVQGRFPVPWRFASGGNASIHQCLMFTIRQWTSQRLLNSTSLPTGRARSSMGSRPRSQRGNGGQRTNRTVRRPPARWR